MKGIERTFLADERQEIIAVVRSNCARRGGHVAALLGCDHHSADPDANIFHVLHRKVDSIEDPLSNETIVPLARVDSIARMASRTFDSSRRFAAE